MHWTLNRLTLLDYSSSNFTVEISSLHQNHVVCLVKMAEFTALKYLAKTYGPRSSYITKKKLVEIFACHFQVLFSYLVISNFFHIKSI